MIQTKIGFLHIFLTNVILFVVIFFLLIQFDGTSAPGKMYESPTSLSKPNDVDADRNCDLFTGEWIPNPEGPYYTNDTCIHIHPNHSCMSQGKPGDYLKWRWKPDGCDLPVFDPKRFLELMRGKSILSVGDSMTSNQMQSLGCLLSRVAVPVEVSSKSKLRDKLIDWLYVDYNLNMSMYWSPFLVRSEQTDGVAPSILHIDAFDQSWTSQIERHSHVIISGGNWYIHHHRQYYENRRRFGCHACNISGVTDLEGYFAFQKALRTALKAINTLARPGGMVILRTISPEHFEGGSWDGGGKCVRRRPYKRDEIVLKHPYPIYREIQLEEFKIAEEQGRRRGLRYALLDTTESILMRPDGHPGQKYGHGPSDCLHSCLPGPADIVNDLLLQLLIRDRQRPTQ